MPVNPPAGAVPITPGADAEQLVQSHRPGTSFLIESGVHPGFSVVPLSGDRFYAQAGAVLDGEQTTTEAFAGVSKKIPSDDVGIIGQSLASPLIIENYTDRGQSQIGTIDTASRLIGPNGEPIQSSGWQLRYLEVTASYSRGITLSNGMVLMDCLVTGNGRLGIGGGGTGIRIEDNTITDNGIGVSRPGFEAGGIKTVGDDVLITDNSITGNGAAGIWTDVDASSVQITSNQVSNEPTGIHVEISHGVTVSDNQVTNDTNNGILISTSDHVTVTGNKLQDDGDGILANGAERGVSKKGVARSLTYLTVRDNTVVDSGSTGVTSTVLPSDHINFNGDQYTGGTFVWSGTTVTFDQWRHEGQERRGTYEQ